MNYFFKKVDGLKADIKRHTEEQKRLERKIEELRDKQKNDPDAFTEKTLKAYEHFLNLLLESKAQLTSKIGKNL